jgi:hypothetical protein
MSALVRSLTRRVPMSGMMCLCAAGVCDDGRRPLWTPTLPHYQSCLEIIEVACAELLDGDCLVVELALFGGIVTLS